MKAVRFHGYGDAGVLVHEDAPDPVAGPGQVLVRVAGAAVNPVDLAIRAGHLRDVFPLTFPHIPNFDVSGTIVEVGAGVDGWAAGDTVIAFLPMTGPGAAAELVAVPAEALAPAPRGGDLADAAALPSAVLTAWQSLFEHGQLTEGRSVLINGAGGSVGGYAVQLAVRAGATVTATASPRSADRTRSYGAHHLIDHTAVPVLDAIAGQRFDLVLNLAPTTPEETARLAEHGTLITVTTPGPDGARVFSHSDGARLAALSALVDAGELIIHVDARRPLAELPAVHARPVPGKTVVLL